MNFFFRKKDEPKSDEVDSRYCIEMSGRPYNNYQDRNASLKIWLPKALEKTLDEVCICIDTTKSDFIRQILFVHLYGRADFLALVKMKHPCLFDKNISDGAGIRFSISNSSNSNTFAKNTPEPQIKNDVGFKVWLPSLMKQDLDNLALKNGMSMSSYAREVITCHLLGHISSIDTALKELPPQDFIEE